MTKKHKKQTKAQARPKEKRLTSLKELADVVVEDKDPESFDANKLIDNILKNAI